MKDNNEKRGEGRVPTMDASEFLFFDSAKEAGYDVNFFVNLKTIKKQNQLFERILFANERKVKKVSLNVPGPL